MSGIRKHHNAEFKTKAAWQLFESHIAKLSTRFGAHPTMIQRWKKEAIAGMTATFSGNAFMLR